MMNVFVYAVRSPDFREMFKSLLFRCDTRGINGRLKSFSITSIKSSSNCKNSIQRLGSLRHSDSNTHLPSCLLLSKEDVTHGTVI